MEQENIPESSGQSESGGFNLDLSTRVRVLEECVGRLVKVVLMKEGLIKPTHEEVHKEGKEFDEFMRGVLHNYPDYKGFYFDGMRPQTESAELSERVEFEAELHDLRN